MSNVIALLAGLVGALIGWMLKTLSELLAENRANKRADAVWRRQHYVDAVANLTHSGRELMSADTAISRATYALINAESGGNQAIIETCRATHHAAVDRQIPWTTATIQALEAVRLYAPANVIERAEAVWDTIYNRGQFPDPTAVKDFESEVLGVLADLRAETRSTAQLA